MERREEDAAQANAADAKRQRSSLHDEARFTLASGRQLPGFTRKEHGGPVKPFFFLQMADTQLGMESNFVGKKAEEYGWHTEMALMRRAAEEVNRLRPAFCIVCGDLADAYPEGENGTDRGRDDLRARQVKDFKETMSLIDQEIPLLCLCGNHDIGDRPNALTVKKFSDDFGDDYFSFWFNGVKCLVLNSQLWKDDQDAKELRVAMDEWLDQELADVAGSNEGPFVLAFSHVPPFIFNADEPDEYFNIDRAVRKPCLARLAAHGCRAWFCGHYHRNAGGVYRDSENRIVEVVVTGAVGTQITDKAGGDPLGKSGIGGHKIGEDDSGLRVVRVWPEVTTSGDNSRKTIMRVEHKWETFSSLASVKREDLEPPAWV